MNSESVNDLPDGWILCDSKSIPGRKYYFNRNNGKSSWSRPEEVDISPKSKKKIKEKKVPEQEKNHSEEYERKNLKRKCSSFTTDEGPSTRCNSTNEKPVPVKKTKCTPIKNNKIYVNNTKSVPERCSHNATPVSKDKQYGNTDLTKNLANKRMSTLRSRLTEEIDRDTNNRSSRHEEYRTDSQTETHSKNSYKSEYVNTCYNDYKYCSSIASPSNDSIQSIPSPSQFLAANKILSSIKAQLPEEYTNKTKTKDTFADIEEGICNQTPEYPSTKHPATPPQFSQASKIVSAIKSKLEYYKSPKEVSECKPPEEGLILRHPWTIVESCDNKQQLDYLKQTPAMKDPLKIMSIEKMEVDEVKQKNIYRSPSDKTHCLNDSIGSINDLVLVVDTNAFIHELDVIRNVLNSHIKGYSEQPTLLVPWRVINELDRLKDNNNGNGAICKRAKAAMDYLYQSLPENDRIKGQSLRDANSHIYPCELPDDEILNCCLQQAERGKSVILLSNDKNLCNKAVINGVRSIGINSLKELLDNRSQGSSDPELNATIKHYQHCIYQLLANILENEMRAKYNKLWQHVLFKAPPWSLQDVLQCLLKHWIAVFNEVFPRIEHLIQELKSVLTRIDEKGPKNVTQSEVVNFKELVLDIARKCQIIPEYMELAKSTVERLCRKADRDGECANSDMFVIEAFESIWTVFSSYCAKLSTSLGVSHNLEDKIKSNDSVGMLRNKWPVFRNQIFSFTLAIKGALSVQESDTSFNDQLTNLELVFRDSLSLISIDVYVNRNLLKLFCTNCRNMLQEAYMKFTQLTELLDICGRVLANE